VTGRDAVCCSPPSPALPTHSTYTPGDATVCPASATGRLPTRQAPQYLGTKHWSVPSMPALGPWRTVPRRRQSTLPCPPPSARLRENHSGPSNDKHTTREGLVRWHTTRERGRTEREKPPSSLPPEARFLFLSHPSQPQGLAGVSVSVVLRARRHTLDTTTKSEEDKSSAPTTAPSRQAGEPDRPDESQLPTLTPTQTLCFFDGPGASSKQASKQHVAGSTFPTDRQPDRLTAPARASVHVPPISCCWTQHPAATLRLSVRDTRQDKQARANGTDGRLKIRTVICKKKKKKKSSLACTLTRLVVSTWPLLARLRFDRHRRLRARAPAAWPHDTPLSSSALGGQPGSSLLLWAI